MPQITKFTPGGDCDCEQDCEVETDAFAREDELIVDSDSTGKWTVGEEPWEIVDEELRIEFESGLPEGEPSIRLNTVVPRQFSFKISVKIPSSGELRVTYTASKDDEDTVLGVEVVPGTECNGQMRLLNGGSVAKEVPLEGIEPDEWHELRLCYSAEQAFLSATFGSQSVSAEDVETPINDLEGSYITILPSGLDPGDYRFDNMRLGKTKTLETETSDYGPADDCPPCVGGGGGCDPAVDTFDGSELDCRWESEGEWLVSDGFAQTSEANARLAWQGSTAGVNENGEVDNTMSVSLIFETDGYENSIVIVLDGSYSVKVTIRSELEDDGTIGIYGNESGAPLASDTVENLDIDTLHTINVCYAEGVIRASVGASGWVEAETDVGSPAPEIGTAGTVSGTVFFDTFALVRNIYDLNCTDCQPRDEPPGVCPMTDDGTIADAIRIRVRGLRNPVGTFGQIPSATCSVCTFFGNRTVIAYWEDNINCEPGPVVPSGFLWEGEVLPIDCICTWVWSGEITWAGKPIPDRPPLTLPPCNFGTLPSGSGSGNPHVSVSASVVKSGNDYYLLGSITFPCFSPPFCNNLQFGKFWKTSENPISLNPPPFGSFKLPLTSWWAHFGPTLAIPPPCVRPTVVQGGNPNEPIAQDVYLLLSSVE